MKHYGDITKINGAEVEPVWIISGGSPCQDLSVAGERQGFYAGQVIKKTDIPKYTRLVMRYNKFYEKDSKRPRFVYCFADSEGYEDRCIQVELDDGKPYKEDGTYYTEDGDRLYTEDEVRKIINGTVSDVEYGIHNPYDILPEDFV